MLVEERNNECLEALGGFWEDGMRVCEDSSALLMPDERIWVDEVAKSLEELNDIKVEEGCVTSAIDNNDI